MIFTFPGGRPFIAQSHCCHRIPDGSATSELVLSRAGLAADPCPASPVLGLLLAPHPAPPMSLLGVSHSISFTHTPPPALKSPLTALALCKTQSARGGVKLRASLSWPKPAPGTVLCSSLLNANN